jgi:carbonic anhydrase
MDTLISTSFITVHKSSFHVGTARTVMKKARAVVISCPDLRLSDEVMAKLIRQAFGFELTELYDHPRRAGGILSLTSVGCLVRRQYLLEEVELLADLHSASEVIGLSHSDCGWCRKQGHSFTCPIEERNFHLKHGSGEGQAFLAEKLPHVKAKYGYVRIDKELGVISLENIENVPSFR